MIKNQSICDLLLSRTMLIFDTVLYRIANELDYWHKYISAVPDRAQSFISVIFLHATKFDIFCNPSTLVDVLVGVVVRFHWSGIICVIASRNKHLTQHYPGQSWDKALSLTNSNTKKIILINSYKPDRIIVKGTVSREKLLNCSLGEMDWTLTIDRTWFLHYLGFYIILVFTLSWFLHYINLPYYYLLTSIFMISC